MNPAVIWPIETSVYLGGWVATARRVYAKWEPVDGEPVSKNEAMGWALLWPIWVPVLYLGKAALAGWRTARRLIFGDLSRPPRAPEPPPPPPLHPPASAPPWPPGEVPPPPPQRYPPP